MGVCVCVCVCLSLSVYRSFHPSAVHPSMYTCIYLPTHHPSIHLALHAPIYPSLSYTGGPCMVAQKIKNPSVIQETCV